MKQTNNAIKFLMAQYRAIFKNAYFKGLTSAVLLTAGLAVAGGVQAGDLSTLDDLAAADEDITITGTSADAGTNNKWANIKVSVTADTPWNGNLTITGGTADTGASGNYILGSGTGNFTLSGTGSLTIDTNDVTNGLYIEDRGTAATDKLTLDISTINVTSGKLDVVDKSSASGSVAIQADTITVGDSAAQDGSATAILSLTASAATQDIGLTLGREANTTTGAVASEITVNEGGVVLLDAGDDTKNNISVLGKSLAVNEGGLLVQTGSSGSNIINTDVLNVAGGQVVSGGSATVKSHEGTVTGNLLVTTDGWLSLQPETKTSENQPPVAGTFTLDDNSLTQLGGAIGIGSKGRLIVTDNATLVASATGNTSGAIFVDAGKDITGTDKVTDINATLQISSSNLTKFLDGGVKYRALSFADNKLSQAEEDTLTDSVQGSVVLKSGGRLDFSDTTGTIDLHKFRFASGDGNSATAGAILVSNKGGIISGNDLTVSDILTSDGKTTAVNDLKLYIEADNLTLGNTAYNKSGSLGFEAARVQDNLNLVASGDTFILADTINADRKYFVQGTDADGDPINTTTLNGTGTITGDNIQIGSGSNTGALNITGGAWTSDSNITIVSGSLAVKADAADNTPDWVNNGNPASLTLTGNVALNGESDGDASITVTGASGADATLDLTNADLVFTNSTGATKSGSITVSGSVTSSYESSPFGDTATNEFYAQSATRGQIGWGKLLLNDRDFAEFLGDNGAQTKFSIGSGGYVYVNGTLTGEHSFDKFSSGTAAHTVNFTGTGVLDINGTLNLFTGVKGTPSTAASDFDIGEGTIAADIIDLHNYNEDRNGVTGLTIAGGTLEVRQGLSTNTDSLTFSGDGTAQLTLAGDFSDTGVASQGTVTTAANGVITLGQSGAISVEGGNWSTTADINVNDAAGGSNTSFTLAVGQEDINLAESLSTDENTVYAASFTGDNFAATVTNALSVGEATRATFNTMQLGDSASATVAGKVVVNGLTGNNLPEEYADKSDNPAYVNKGTTAGIDLGTSIINITGGSFEFGEVASSVLIQQNQSGSDWTTDSINETANKSTFAVSDAIADTKFNVTEFGELKFNLSSSTLLNKYDARFLTQTLLEGYDTASFQGYLNLGNAELNVPFEDSPVAGVEQVAWDEVADFADLTYGAATTERMKNAIITNIDSRNDFVKGHYGSLQVNVDPSNTTLNLGGSVSLHNAVGGYFVFSGTPSADGTGMTAVGVALSRHALELENGGKIGSISGTNDANNDVYFHGTGTTEVLGSISDINELYVDNATIVNGAVETAYLDLTNTLDVAGSTGSAATEGNITLNAGDLASTAVLNANDLSVGYVQNAQEIMSTSLDIAGTVNLSGDLKINNGYDVELFNGKLSAVNVTLDGANANLIVGYEPNEGDKDDPATEYYNEALSYGGLFESTGTTTLNGGMLAVDPDYAQPAAMASLNNLSHTSTAQVTDLIAGSLDGKLFVGQNAALGIGSDSLATLQAKVAKFQNANGAFNPEEIGSVVYLGKSFDIDSTKAGLILTSQSIQQFMDTFNAGNAANATGVFADFNTTADFETTLRNNLVYLGDNAAILVDAAVMSAADTSLGTNTEAVISFTNLSGDSRGQVIADGGDVIIDGDVRASTYQVFSNATISYLDGTAYAEVTDSKAAHYEDNINVSTENDFLQGVVQADGTVTLGVNPNGRAIMRGASDPVYASLLAYARGYNGEPTKDDAGNEVIADSQKLYNGYVTTTNEAGDTVRRPDYGNYSNYFLQETISTGDGSAAEAVARLAVYGGAAQAAISAGASTYDAVSGRMGVGANGANITVADNTQGAALWLAPIYKSSDSDGFDAEGVDYGVDMDLYGVALGADYTLSNGIRFGAMFNVGSGDVDGQGAGSGVSNDFDYYGFAVYGGYSMGALSVVADVSYTVADNDLEGNTSIDRVGATLDSTNLSLGVTGQYQLDFNGTTVTPHAGLRFSRIDLDDYSVDGEGVIANYDADSMNIFSIPVGVTFAKEFTGDAWTVKPSLDLTLTGNFGDDETDGTVHWAGVENLSTNVSSEVLDNFTYGATLGVAAKTGNFSLGLGVNYTGSSNVDEFGVQANARFVF